MSPSRACRRLRRVKVRQNISMGEEWEESNMQIVVESSEEDVISPIVNVEHAAPIETSEEEHRMRRKLGQQLKLLKILIKRMMELQTEKLR